MALLSLAQVNDRAAALLDDPGHRRFSRDYLRAHIDQQNESMMITLERLGVQQQEVTAIFNVPVNTRDLTPYFATGQPLETFLRPIDIDWKLQGQPDTTYQTCWPAKELDDVDPSNLGSQQYTWQGGTLQITPSGTAETLRIRFFALTASVFDDQAQIMRGIGFILAEMVAAFVAALNNGMGTLQKKLEKDLARDKQNITNLFVMQQQKMQRIPRNARRTIRTQISQGGNSLT